jgi:hypothetical protein
MGIFIVQSEESLDPSPPPQELRSKPPGGKGRRARDAHLRQIEQSLRRFLDYADAHPMHRFAQGTQKFLIEVRPIVEQLDTLDCERK